MRSFVFFLASFAALAVCHARTITVDDDGAPDFDSIQVAIADANDGDTVLVADGTYTGPGNRNIDFLGKAITGRNWQAKKLQCGMPVWADLLGDLAIAKLTSMLL
jgi:hypothetical protein